MELIEKQRLRRNRKSDSIRSLVRETILTPYDLVVPLFVIEGKDQEDPILKLPGIYRMSKDKILKKAVSLFNQQVRAIALFPVLDQSKKSLDAKEAFNPNGLICQTIRLLKKELPDMCVISDIALDPFTTHGHDGIVKGREIVNDETVQVLAKMALYHAEAGVDMVAPSDMMDHRVGCIRKELDQNGFSSTSILAYSIKYASSLYAPFRSAVHSHLSFGDKKTYQMDPANQKEALLEAKLDEMEGADILMVKPATLYLDVIAKLRESSHKPIAAYHVSGEYTMVKAAEHLGYLNASEVFYEMLLGIKRAGASFIFSYAAEQILDKLVK